MIKLVLFDLDGVLIDAKKIHYVALNDAIEYISAYSKFEKDYTISEEEHTSTYDGLKTTQKLDMLTKKKWFTQRVARTNIRRETIIH